MNAFVFGQLWMESGGENPTLAREHRLASMAGQDLNVRAGAANDRGADEDHGKERGPELGARLLGEVTIHLPTVRVPLHGHVHETE